MRKLLFLVLLMLNVTGAKAHELQALRNHYTTSDGLASNAIADIVEDRFGYIWIATWNGLSRFDGYNFCNYPTGKNSGLSNFHNRILTLTADNMGNIWMRMYDNRIFVLNRHTDIIANAFESVEGGDLLKTNNGYQGKTHRTASTIVKSIDGYVYAYIRQKGIYRMRSVGAKPMVQLVDIGKQKVYAMATDKHANLWVATDKGLAKIKPTETKLNNAFVMDNKEIMNICCTANNTILVGTTKGDIYNVGSKKKIYSTNGSQISSLYQDSQSLIWFTTDTQGVFQYNPATNTTRHFTQIVSTPEIDINGAAYSEANGALWVRMNMGGFGYYDYAGRDELFPQQSRQHMELVEYRCHVCGIARGCDLDVDIQARTGKALPTPPMHHASQLDAWLECLWRKRNSCHNLRPYSQKDSHWQQDGQHTFCRQRHICAIAILQS